MGPLTFCSLEKKAAGQHTIVGLYFTYAVYFVPMCRDETRHHKVLTQHTFRNPEASLSQTVPDRKILSIPQDLRAKTAVLYREKLSDPTPILHPLCLYLSQVLIKAGKMDYEI